MRDTPTEILVSVATQNGRDKPPKLRRRPEKLPYLENKPFRTDGNFRSPQNFTVTSVTFREIRRVRDT